MKPRRDTPFRRSGTRRARGRNDGRRPEAARRADRWGPRWGRHFLVAMALVLAIVGLSACTGTREVRPPVVLVVGEGSDALTGPRLLLLEDTFATVTSGGEGAPDIVALPWSEIPTSLDPVDFAVEDANGVRDTLWVLERAPGGDDSLLQRFDMTGIDLVAEQGLVPVGGPLTLDEPGEGTGFLETSTLPGDPRTAFCPAEVDVSDDGRYVALLEDEAACGTGSYRALYLIDTAPSPPEILNGGAAVFVDVGSAGIRVDRAASTLVYADTSNRLTVRDLATGVRLDSDPLDDVALGSNVSDLALTDTAAIALGTDELVVVPRTGDDSTQVPTLDDGLALVPDVTGTDRAFVVGDTGATSLWFRFAFHEPIDADPYEESIDEATIDPVVPRANRSAATLEPFDGFAYLLRGPYVVVVDLLRRDTALYGVPELEVPRLVTWTRASVFAVP